VTPQISEVFKNRLNSKENLSAISASKKSEIREHLVEIVQHVSLHNDVTTPIEIRHASAVWLSKPRIPIQDTDSSTERYCDESGKFLLEKSKTRRQKLIDSLQHIHGVY
jgi:hypothetical protein